MKITKVFVRSILALSIGFCCGLPLSRAGAADFDATIPSVIQTGFDFYTKGQPELAVDAWRKGGVLQDERTGSAQGHYFREMERVLGRYKSYELIENKGIGKSSKLVYLSINYERGAVYARFLVYRFEKDWVVEKMDFNRNPEVVMPWLALAGGAQTE